MRRARNPIYRGLTGVAALSMLLGTAAGVQASSARHQTKAANMTLHITWFKWAPADALQVMGNDYHKLHPNITIKVDEPPATQWNQSQFTQYAAHHTSFQMAVGDSQWLGQEAIEHDVVDLTAWIKQNLNVKDYLPYMFAAYSQYPQAKLGHTGTVDLVHGHFYGVPFESDGLAWAYRKDLFNNPATKRAFKARYHYALGVPKNWTQISDIAQFFTRPKNKLWGVAVHESSAYDAAAEFFDETLWNFGGDLWNGSSGQIQGVANSSRAVAALKYDQQLVKYAPPGSGNWWIPEVNTAFNQGSVAMVNNWWGALLGVLDPSASKLGKSRAAILKKVGFFMTPPNTFQGKTSHVTALGGQGMSISNYITDAEKAASEAFIKWTQGFNQQVRWAQLGGGPTTRSVLNSHKFAAALPYAKLEARSYHFLKDFWNVPDYNKMLTVQGTDINGALTGGKTATDALNDMAKQQQHYLCLGVRLHREPNWSYCASHPTAR